MAKRGGLGGVARPCRAPASRALCVSLLAAPVPPSAFGPRPVARLEDAHTEVAVHRGAWVPAPAACRAPHAPTPCPDHVARRLSTRAPRPVRAPPVRALQGRGEGVKPHTLLAAPIKGTAQPPHSRPCIHRPPLPPPRRAPRSEPRATNLSTLASPQLPSAASRAASLSRSCPSAPETPLQWPPPPGAAVRNRRHRFHPVSGPKSVHGEPLNLPRYSLTEVWRGIDGISDRTVASRSWRLHCDPTYCSRGLNARQGPVCKESKTSRDLFEICILNSDFSFVDSCKICRKS
jgi:hypothetical protein